VDAVREPYNPKTIKTFASSPKAGFGKVPDLERGKVPEDWWYFPVVARLHKERTGYPTQKPQPLLERIILATTKPGDLVADFFCGAGTTSLVASQHERRFIANDLSWRAVHTSRTRHIAGSDTPFKMLNEINLRQERLSGGSDGVKIAGAQLENEPDLEDNLDYWEVDLDWGGEVFRSAAQAVRPRKKEPISGELALPEPIGEKQIAVRLVNIDGIQTQIIYPG